MNQLKTDFLKKIADYFTRLPFSVKGKGICCCLSGGADSVSLLLSLIELKDKLEFNLYACHFNHMIRGEEADRDEQFCKNLCKTNSVELFLGMDDVPAYARLHKKTLEEAARECRYMFFERLCSKKQIDFCATAHNKNDDVETFLMNLIRGSGSNGGSSIAPYSENILRPMLSIARQEIEDYLKSVSQDFVYDSTNSSFEHTRNYVRSVVLPELLKINPNAVEAISRYIESNREDREYFDIVVENNLTSDLRNLHASLRKRVIIRKFKDFCGKSLNFDQIQTIDRLLFSDERKVIAINSEVEAVIDSGCISFFEKKDDFEQIFQPIEIKLGSNLVFDNAVEITLSKDPISLDNVYNLYKTDTINYDNIIGGLFVRNRRIGDKITLNGVNKSLKKLFIDKKIPKEYRNIIPIIYDEQGIIYVPFIGVADRVKVKTNVIQTNLYVSTIFNSMDKERWMSSDEK